MRTLIIFALLCLPLHAATVFVSQAGGTVSCGADGSLSTTAVGSVGTLVGGNTYKICGALTAQWIPTGSGSSGSPITISFENNSGMTNALFPITGALDLAGLSWYVVDGQIPCGPAVNVTSCIAIQNTANGTGLTNHTDQTCGINVDGASQIIIQNLAIINIYVRNSTTDVNVTSQPAPSHVCAGSVNNLTIHDYTFHDANWSIAIANGSVSNHLLFYNGNQYNVDHCFAVGVVSQTDTDVVFHDDSCHDVSNWDDTSGTNKYHHDGIHLYTTTGTGKITAAYAWNMTFSGNWGIHNTSMVFEEGPSGGEVDLTVYNSLFLNTGATVLNNGWWNNGNITGGGNVSVTKGYNNTFINPVTTLQAYGVQALFTDDFRNNVLITSDTSNGNTFQIDATSTGTIDYGAYASPSGTPFIISAVAKSYAQWKTAGWDAHGVSTIGTAPYNLNASTGVPNSSFAGIGAGLNLCTALGCTGNLTALALDETGATRPASAAWDIGAISFTTSNSGPDTLGQGASCGPGCSIH